MPTTALKAVEPAQLDRDSAGAVMENVIAKGDLSQLKPDERARYYMEVCHSLGLNPLTKPFEYITLNSKLTLYATRTATDQLREIKGVSIQIVDRRREDDLYIVVTRATSYGRTDESTGAVSIAGLKGDALANAYMKAETKAKRRVTLSICGLGWMDETEAETVRGARFANVDTQTGEIVEAAPDRIVDTATGEVMPDAKTAKERRDDHRIEQNRRFHGIAHEVGLTDAATALYAHAVTKSDSRSKLTGQELSDLADVTDEQLERLPDGSINPLVEMANKIAAAADENVLSAIATQMSNDGLLAPWLVEMGRKRREELKK